MEKHNKKKKTINKKGFTLIELLATLAVLSLVTSIVLYTAVNIIDDTKENTYKVTINNIEKNASNYALESIPYLTWIKSEGIEYQCVTIENLIEKGYFDNDILSSEIKKGRKVQLTDTIYIERDSNKTITKSNLLSGNATEYSSMCQKGSASGQITFNATPKGWSKEKEVTIYFNLFDNIEKTSAYKYTYEFYDQKYSENFKNRSVEKKLTINKNGNILANIYDVSGKIIASHTRYIDKIDNEGPIIKFNYNGATTVRNSITIPIEITDNGSGVNYNTFSISDIEVKIGSKIITNGLSLIKNKDDTYDLKIENNDDAGALSITIKKGKILDNIENENENTTLDKNITFDNTYTISYNANGGTGNIRNTICTYGETCSINANTFTKTGYTFQGWTTNSNGTDDSYNWTNWSGTWKYKDNENGIKDGKLTLYAVWKSNTYTIKYNLNYNLVYGLENKGNTTSDYMSYSVNNKAVTVTANYDDGYGFTNGRVYLEANKTYVFNATTNGTWSSDQSGVEAFLMREGAYDGNWCHLAENVNYEFTPKITGEYWLRLDVNEKGKTYTFSNINITEKSGLSPQTKTHGKNLTLSSTKPTRTGYTFQNWNTKSDGSGTSYSPGRSYTSNSGATLYAVWKTNTYTISYNANGGSGEPSSQTKTYGKNLTLSSTKPTRTGYAFLKWNTKSDGSGTSYNPGESYTSNSGTTLYAIWKENSSNCKNNYDQYSNEYLYFTRDNVTCYNEPSTSSGNKLGFDFGWCDDWMNGDNGDNDPNYITVRKTGISGWYYSVSYCCYVPSSDLSGSISTINNAACPKE